MSASTNTNDLEDLRNKIAKARRSFRKMEIEEHGGYARYYLAQIGHELTEIKDWGLLSYFYNRFNQFKEFIILLAKDFIAAPLSVQVVFFVVLTAIFAYSPFIAHGSSMLPTMKGGEVGFVNKMVSKNAIDYGDIIVIDCGNFIKKCIKRVVAKPGDQLMIRNDRIYLNGKLLERKSIEHKDYAFSKAYIDKKTYGLLDISTHTESLPNGVTFTITSSKLNQRGKKALKHALSSSASDLNVDEEGKKQLIEQLTRFGRGLPDTKITLGKDEFFVLGDNRILSKDSIQLGPIHWDEIHGRSDLITSTWLRYPFAWFAI